MAAGIFEPYKTYRVSQLPATKRTPNQSPNDGKLIFGSGRKRSRGGLKVVLERWFFVSQQNQAVPGVTCCSARIIIFCQDHHFLPGSSSSARIIIFFKGHHSFPKKLLEAGFVHINRIPVAISQNQCFLLDF